MEEEVGMRGQSRSGVAGGRIGPISSWREGMGWRSGAARDGTRGCGCGCEFSKNPPTGKPAGAFLHPHPRISGGFRVPAVLTTDIIKIYKFINLNSQITHFYE